MGWQDEIGPKTQEFLAQFGEAFLKSYGVSLFLKIKAEVAAEHEEAADHRQLQYRSWDSVPRVELLSGSCWMRSGDGPGAFGGWTGVYVAEQQDYSLAVYKDAKAAASGDLQKAQLLLLPAGYSLQRSVENFYWEQARDVASELECEPPDVSFSRFSWALAHPLRSNYVFQLHKAAGGGCFCFGGAKVEPDAGAENQAQAEEWSSIMGTMISNSSPRDLETDTVAMAFERTVQKLALSNDQLDGFSDDGTEAQILGHLAFVAVFEASCKAEIQEQAKKAPLGRVALWYKSRGSAAAMVQKAVDPAWAELRAKAAELGAKLEPEIRSGLQPMLSAQLQLQDKLKAQFGEKIGEAMAAKVTPSLAPLIHAFDKPMRQGVSDVLKVYEMAMHKQFGDSEVTGELPVESCQRLDEVARRSEDVQPLEAAADALLEPLDLAKTAAGGVLEQLDTSEARQQCLDALLQLLDAAIFTTQEEMKKDGARLADVRKKVAADCASDGNAAACACVRAIATSALLSVLAKVTAPLLADALESLKELIPEDLQEILDVEAEYNMLLESTIAEAAGKIVDAKFNV